METEAGGWIPGDQRLAYLNCLVGFRAVEDPVSKKSGYHLRNDSQILSSDPYMHIHTGICTPAHTHTCAQTYTCIHAHRHGLTQNPWNVCTWKGPNSQLLFSCTHCVSLEITLLCASGTDKQVDGPLEEVSGWHFSQMLMAPMESHDGALGNRGSL